MRLTEDGGSQGSWDTKFASSTLTNESILLKRELSSALGALLQLPLSVIRWEVMSSKGCQHLCKIWARLVLL